MNKLVCVAVSLLLFSGHASADPTLTEDVIKDISVELKHAMQNGDIAVFKKYLYPGSKIVVDMDPSNSAGQVEVSYDEYMQLLEISLPLMQNAVLHDEVLSISIDDQNNQATIREKTDATIEMMGVKIRDVSISETTYGVVNGQIKALTATDQLISSEQIRIAALWNSEPWLCFVAVLRFSPAQRLRGFPIQRDN